MGATVPTYIVVSAGSSTGMQWDPEQNSDGLIRTWCRCNSGM